MGIFSKLFHRQPKNTTFAPTLSGFSPIYGQYGANIYQYDVVRQSLKCIVDEIKKLNPTHIRYKNSDPIPVKGSLQDVLENPNPLMTTVDFLEKTTYLLLLNLNAFILPVYDVWKDEKTGEERRYYRALYPIRPSQVDFLEDPDGRIYVKFWFWNGSTTTVHYDDVIHIRLKYSLNEYMGGNEFGQTDNEPILKTLQLNEKLLQGIAKAMNASYAINGIIKINSYLDDEKLKGELAEFERKLNNNESGFLPIDLKNEIQPFERKSQIVDEPTLNFIDSKIRREFGVPQAILDGDFTKDQLEAFYQHTLEPIVKAISQAFTKKLFTEREKAFGNRIELYPEELIFMSIGQTLEMINTLAPQGGGYVNEYRTWLGLRPLPELEGKRFMSLNWVDADKASEYQMGKINVDVVDEEKTVTEE